MQKTILITGASSGIGLACATRFASLNNRIILCGRRTKLLNELSANLQSEYKVETLVVELDVRKFKDVKDRLENLPVDWKNIDVLVNNAGLAAGLDPVQSGDIEDWDAMIDTNIKGLLHVTRVVSPWMISRGSGHIINIGSIAGKEVYPKGNVYCATKFAVDALTKGMRIDFLPYGIRVSQICPGAAETEFSEVRFKGDKQQAANVYKGYTPLSADNVAEAVTWVAGLPSHVNINDLVIMPTAQASPAYFNKNL